MFEIISSADERTTLNIMEEHIKSSPDDPWSTCPWVKVGNLYLSVTQTGSKSWATLVDHIRKGTPGASFVVFSGRHGEQAGQAVSEKAGIYNEKRVREGQFYQDDLAMAGKYNGAVAVKDVGDQGTTRDLKADTLNAMGSKIPIWGWCFSIFSMMDFGESLYSKTYELQKGANKGKNIAVESRALYLGSQSIKSLVTEWYDWVK